MAHATAHFWVPRLPGAMGWGQRSNIIKSQLLSQFQRFLNQTLCVFSQMKNIKYISLDFHKVPWVMPKGLRLWGAGGSKTKFSEHGHVEYQIKGDDQ